MQQSSQNGDPISSARQATSPSTGARRNESGAAVALAALLGLVALTGAGCDGGDSTDFPSQGGSSGSGGGRSGAGGATAGASGSGGRAGTSGAGGSTAGAGGASGSAGTGGTGAGTGGTAEVPDGGVDGGDAAAPPELSQREITGEAICATGDSLDGCDRSPTCLEVYLSFYTDFIEPNAPTCVDEADAYFECQAAQPATAYECAGDPLIPQYTVGTPACEDEENAFYAGVFSEFPECP